MRIVKKTIELIMRDVKAESRKTNIAAGNKPKDGAGIPGGVLPASLTRGFFAPDGIYETVIKGKGHLMKFCDKDCNHCPVIAHPNSRMLTKVLNELQDKFGDGVYEIVQRNCPNFTVCYDCRIDDFCHVEGCKIVGEEEE